MSEANTVFLTTEEIAGWEQEAAQLEASIARQQQQLAALKRKLEAVAILRDSMPATAAPHPRPGQLVPQYNGAETEVNEPMTDAVIRIARERRRPVPKAELKEELRRAGFAPERLGNYFYTVIARLKEKRKIAVNPDGSISALPNLFD